MLEKECVDFIDLQNGQRLEVSDCSREIADNTCCVGAIFRIHIEVSAELFSQMETPPKLSELTERLGETVLYEVTREKKLVLLGDKKCVFEELKRSFLDTNLNYLSHPEFPVRYVMKCYNSKG